MGITEDVWARLQAPRGHSSDDLAQTSPLYFDVYVALELLHCTYEEYIQRTSQRERLLLQFWVMLRNAKEEFAHDDAERQRELDREMAQEMNGMFHGRG